jgi:hypothetical protein
VHSAFKVSAQVRRVLGRALHSARFPAAFALAHLARAAAASLALTAGLLRRSLFLVGFCVVALPFTLAHLARCAAAILALLARDMRRRRFLGAPSVVGDNVPSPSAAMDSIRPWSVSIFSLIAMILLS